MKVLCLTMLRLVGSVRNVKSDRVQPDRRLESRKCGQERSPVTGHHETTVPYNYSTDSI
jgi:hypothetical protein